jgi:uncharacterized protein YndB with AHSA1/START domain
VNGILDDHADPPVLRFERRLPHPVAKVWRAVTEPEELSHWFPSDVELDFRVGGKIRFVFREGEGPTLDGEITELDPPRVFAFTWGDSLLRFELSEVTGGCLLVFTHAFTDRPAAASFAAGWHICLDGLAEALDGESAQPPGRVAELHSAYATVFGLLRPSVAEGPDGWTIRFEDQLTRPVDAVWALLCGTPDGEQPPAPGPGQPAPAGFTTAAAPAGPVTDARAPNLLEYGWVHDGQPAGLVRWELSDGQGGARVVVTQTVPARLAGHRAAALAAWHAHLERLAGRAREQATAQQATARAEELAARYRRLLG